MEELLELKTLLLGGNISEALLLVEEMTEMSKDDKLNKIFSFGIILGSPLLCVITHAYGFIESFHSNPFAVIFSRLVITMTHFPHS
jgi:hypothetical protein